MELTEDIKKKRLAHYKKACKLQDAKRFEDALNEVDKALDLGQPPKGKPGLFLLKAGIYYDLKKYKEAKKCALKAKELKPNDFEVFLHLGLIHYHMEEYKEASKYFRKALKIHPRFTTYTLLANAELTFNPKKSLKSAEAALALNPKWDEAINIRDKALKLIKKEEKQKKK